MKDIKDLKKGLKTLIIDRVTLCLDELERIVNDDSQKYNGILLLTSQYKEIKTKEHNGTFNPAVDGVLKEQLKSRILDFITDLEEADLVDNALEPTGIRAHILVVTHDETSKAEMEKFFSSYTFSHVTYDCSNEVIRLKACDLIVFDNRIMGQMVHNPQAEEDLEEKPKQHLTLLKSYLENTKFNIVYYGEILYILNKYRDRVNAANSKFTLYARINETIECMKYYKEE
jgi:hypothetical protein